MGNPLRDRQFLLMMVLGVCTVNGIFSPYLNVAIPVTAVLMPEMFPRTAEWVLFFSSIFVACITLFFSGVPAALYERLTAAAPESPVAMYIWLAGAVLMTLPAVPTLEAL